ncbi:hypothetical protein C8J57DRAFT_1295794, partial [Mycena rebaudengoi]
MGNVHLPFGIRCTWDTIYPRRCSSLRAERIPCLLHRICLFRFLVDSFLRIWWLFTSRCASTPKLALAARHTQNRLRYSQYVPVLSFVSSCTVRYSHILFRIIVLCFFPPSSCYIGSIPSTFRTCRTDCNFFCLSIYLLTTVLSFHLSYSCGQSTIFTGIHSCKLAHSVTVCPSQPPFCSTLSRIVSA